MEEQDQPKTRVAAVADIHIREYDKNKWTGFFREVSQNADVLLICGDLTDTGDEAEAKVLSDELKSCTIPVVAVLGNHDYEKGRQKLIRQIIQNDNVHILDGESIIIKNIGFAGIKGFGGGFDNFMLSMFGEDGWKSLVQEAVDEALQLDRALTRLDASHEAKKKIVLMHYAPIKDTIVGEPESIHPFLGCSRLADPLNNRKIEAAFHGHAHAGNLKSRTASGVDIYNVAIPILIKEGYTTPYYLLEV